MKPDACLPAPHKLSCIVDRHRILHLAELVEPPMTAARTERGLATWYGSELCRQEFSPKCFMGLPDADMRNA